MSVPNTPLLIAPPGESDMLGRPMPGSDIERGLRRLNRLVYIHKQGPIHSGIWIGKPGADGTRFICAFHLGMVPEWSQIASDGKMIAKGWRAIFEKCVRGGVATRERIEREFRVSLQTGYASNLCTRCAKEGHRTTHNGGKWRLCDMHESIYDAADRAKRSGPERLDRAAWTKTKEFST